MPTGRLTRGKCETGLVSIWAGLEAELHLLLAVQLFVVWHAMGQCALKTHRSRELAGAALDD